MTTPANNRGPVSPFGFAVLGSELAGATVVGVLFDWWFATLPWITIVGTFAGLLAVFVHMAQMIKAQPPGPPQP